MRSAHSHAREHEQSFRYITKTSFYDVRCSPGLIPILFADSVSIERRAGTKGKFMFNICNRAIAAVTAAAIALGTIAVNSANAGPRYRSYRSDAAAASIMLGIIGAVAAYAAAREYRKAQEARYRYYGRGYYDGFYRYGYGGPYRSDGY